MTPTAPSASLRSVGRRKARALSTVVLSVGVALILGTSPFPQARKPLLDAYDFSKDAGAQEDLPRALEEISGLASTPDGRVLAHHDERAVVYELDPITGKVLKAFSAGIGGVRGDFEGIALAEDRIFLVTSDGDLLELQEGNDGSAMAFRRYSTNLDRLCEIEGLAYDDRTTSLLLPCKKTRAREFEDHIVVLAVGLDRMEVYPVPRIFIPFEALDTLDLKDSFHPSAIEVHPESGRSLLVSAQEESILEVSVDGLLVAGRELHRKTHPQPEGITFLEDGSLLLADEGQGKRGRLTRYSADAGTGGGKP